MEGWVDLGDRLPVTLYTKMVYPSTDGHQSPSSTNPAVHSRESNFRHSIHYTTKLPVGMSLAICDQCYLPPDTSEHIPPNPSQAGRHSIYLPRRDRRLSWSRWPVTHRDGLPAHRRSPIHVLTQQCTAGSSTRNLLITSPMHSNRQWDCFI